MRLSKLCIVGLAGFVVILRPSVGSAAEHPATVLKADELEREILQSSASTSTRHLITGTDGGGSMVVYSERNRISRIFINVGLSNRQVHRNYYFRDGVVALVTSEEFIHAFDDDHGTSPRLVKSSEERYYFEDAKMTYWITVRQSLGATTEMADGFFLHASKTIGDEAQLLFEAAKTGQDTVDVEKSLKGSVR